MLLQCLLAPKGRIRSALALQQVLAVCMEVKLPWHSHHLLDIVVASPKLHVTCQRLPICVHTSGRVFRAAAMQTTTTKGPIAAPSHLIDQLFALTTAQSNYCSCACVCNCKGAFDRLGEAFQRAALIVTSCVCNTPQWPEHVPLTVIVTPGLKAG